MASKRRPAVVEPSAAPDVDVLRARIAELEARQAAKQGSERVQDALYRIAEAASAATDLQAFYRTIHEIVGDLMYARNFYIALHDAERGRLNYPYSVDEFDPAPDPNAWEPFGEGQARGITAYALRLGRPLLVTSEQFRELEAAGELEQVGVVTEAGTWMCAPLPAEGRNQGLLVVQTYSAEHRYTDADLDLLDLRRPARRLGAQPGPVRSRRPASGTPSSALINEIGGALAKQLDFDSIIDLVGERVRAIFDATDMFVAIHDAERGLIHFPFDYRRRPARPIPSPLQSATA